MADLPRAGLAGVAKADKYACEVATSSRDGRQETAREPHLLAGTVAGNEDDLDMPTMKHNDLQLQELLRLSRSCLKYDRLPGELSERKFFDKFDAEHAEQSKLELGDSADQSLDAGPSAPIPIEDVKNVSGLELSPPLEGPGEDPPDARTLRRQTSQLELTIAEARQALEAASVALGQEVLKRQKFEKDEKTAEVDFQKTQHQLRLAKDMVKRQTGEIKKLHGDIQVLKTSAIEAARPILHPPVVAVQPKADAPHPPAAAAKGKGGPRPGGRPLSLPGDAGARSPGEQAAVKQPSRPLPRMVESIVLPLKSKTFEAVLLSRPKDPDAWKKLIP